MKIKIIQSIPALFALLAIGFSNFSIWCIFTTRACYGTVIDHINFLLTQPLYFFALYFLPIAIILAFVPREIFKSWLKFAVWALPLLFIFIVIQPVSPQQILSTDRDDAARLAGGVFAGLSLILILWKWFSSRRNSGQV